MNCLRKCSRGTRSQASEHLTAGATQRSASGCASYYSDIMRSYAFHILPAPMAPKKTNM
jgi:hypothetical protein